MSHTKHLVEFVQRISLRAAGRLPVENPRPTVARRVREIRSRRPHGTLLSALMREIESRS